MHGRCRMTDEPVSETLETIAASIRELRTSIESRFGDVDNRFDKIDGRFANVDTRLDKIDGRFDEMKAQLRTEIESVRGDVRLVAEGLAAQTVLLQRLDNNHRRLEERVDKHDLRILALEPKRPA